MVWLGIFLFIGVIGLIALLVALIGHSDEDVMATGLVIAVIALVLNIIVTFGFSINQVGTGSIGIVYSYGKIVGQQDSGVHLHAPWKTVTTANLQTQTKDIKKISAASLETQDVFVDLSFSFALTGESVQNLFRTVGPDYYEKLAIENRITQYVKEETARYPAVEIQTLHREDIRRAVQQHLTEDLAKYSIIVTNVVVVDIEYSPEFNASIEAKQVQTQNSLKATEAVKQAQAEAEQARAKAQGAADSTEIQAKADADNTLIRAKAQADANQLLNQSLSPNVIQYEYIQKLAPTVQTILVPSGNGFLLDPSALVGASTVAGPK